MIRYHFLLFARNLFRQKMFSFINLLGLTVSIASTMLIYLYVRHEFSYDRFHRDADRIYRINQTFIWGENNNSQFASTGPGVAYAVKEELAEVELISSIHTPGNFIVSYTSPGQEVITFEEDRVLAADSNFFEMFTFPMVAGNKETALRQPNTLVMTRSTAERYFGKADPIGKLVQLAVSSDQQRHTYEVTGVVEDTPDNSYIEFDVLLSMKSFPVERFHWSWVWTQLETYVRLHPDADVDQVREKLEKIPEKHAGPTLEAAFNTTYEDYIKSGKKWELFLQPLTSIHLPTTTVINRLNDSVSRKIIYSFIGAAIFIVVLSCVNFMNLSTAQFTRRLKEVSMRKVLGLGKKELVLNYFFEAVLFCLIALVAAIGITELLLPGFNILTERSLELNLLNDPDLLAGMLVLVMAMAMISCSYPSLFLTSFNPVRALKGKIKVGRDGKRFRNSLVVFQFSISIFLILCTATVFQQLNFVSSKDIGFDRENLVVINHVEMISNGSVLTEEAGQLPGVKSATWCRSVPPRIWGGDSFTAEGTNGLMFPLNYTSADDHYLPTLDIRLLIGRNFRKDTPADAQRVIVNEATLKKIGWDVNESVLGKKIIYPGNENAEYEIIGVVRDFNYWSLTNPIEPMAIFHINDTQVFPGNRQFLALRMDPQHADQWENLLLSIEKLWKKHAGDSPFNYSFVDQSFAETFKSQQQLGNVLTVMASLAILIASLGLLGMIIYALEQRTKEIGIRKVSGASVSNIVIMVSKGYTRLIALAFLIGAPLAYYSMNQWLEDFAYRVSPSLLTFLLTGLGTLVVATLITGYHTWQAAMTNPVEVLKDE